MVHNEYEVSEVGECRIWAEDWGFGLEGARNDRGSRERKPEKGEKEELLVQKDKAIEIFNEHKHQER